ncbi:unnamed protein product [Gadus morhua 'NCC']
MNTITTPPTSAPFLGTTEVIRHMLTEQISLITDEVDTGPLIPQSADPCAQGQHPCREYLMEPFMMEHHADQRNMTPASIVRVTIQGCPMLSYRRLCCYCDPSEGHCTGLLHASPTAGCAVTVTPRCQGPKGHVVRPVVTECQSASVQQDSEATALSGHLPVA